MPWLADLTGTNEPSLAIGVVNANPVAGASYSGAPDLDWWYQPNVLEIDANLHPLTQLGGSIASSVLTAGPGSMRIRSVLEPGVELRMSSSQFAATTGRSSAPLQSADGGPPGHLATEEIPPALVSFASMTGGKLKGNISARSLANTPIPTSFVGSVCTALFTANRTWLDLLTTGCTASILIPVILVRQPDTVDPNAPPAGAGGPYLFTRTGTVVTGCRDVTNAIVNLETCLDAAAYSAYFTFTTDRVIYVGGTTTLNVNIAGGAGSGTLTGPDDRSRLMTDAA